MSAYTVELSGSDLVLLAEALAAQAAIESERQRSIRHTARCTISEAMQRYPGYRISTQRAARCFELASQLRRTLNALPVTLAEEAPE